MASLNEMDVVRETPSWKVRENMAWNRNRVLQLETVANLAAHHHLDHFDDSLLIVPEPERNAMMTRLIVGYEQIGVWFCYIFHKSFEYNPGDHYYTCECGRRFAVPWADPTRLPKGTYFQTVHPKSHKHEARANSKLVMP